ncbi:MAG: SDR family NAD(P)-dependent oxidoreductase [Anaerolineae bacterium]
MSTIPTILITGASRGLGAAAARIAAQLGAAVILNARSAADLEKVAAAINREGGTAVPLPGDVSDTAVVPQLINQAIEQFGRLDALVNNAGMIEPITAIANANTAVIAQNLAVNLLGPMALTQAALPHLRQSQGRVINVSSGAAVNAVPGWAAYCAAKAGLNHVTRVLAEEEPQVTAVTLRPGIINTEMQATIRREGAGGMPPSAYAKYLQYHAQGHLLPPEKPARALAILALYALPEWSGSFLSWNDTQVQAMIQLRLAANG